MNRTLAGLHDPGGTMSPQSRRAATRRATGNAATHVVEAGPLTLAYTGPEVTGEAGGCVLDGHVYNLEAVVSEAGIREERSEEAILAALYARLGDALFERLRGDFALVLWPADGREVTLVRDQLGGRPLVMSTTGSRVAFASETRELLRVLPTSPSPDPVSMAHWLAISGPPADRTLYEGVRWLEPGHLARLARGGYEARRYWFPARVSPLNLGREDAAAALREAIVRAVERRIRPHEPVGVMLSGGLDSTGVAAVACRALDEDRAPRAGYSAVFPNHPALDESRYIDALVGEVDLPSVRIAVEGGSVIRGAVEYLQSWGVPPVSPNLFFWNPLLRRAADDGVTTLLDGEGGDAIFYFSPYLLADRLRRGRVLSAMRLARRFPGPAPSPARVMARMKAFGVRPAVPVPGWLAARRRLRHDPAESAPRWFTPELARLLAETDESRLWEREPGPRWSTWLLSTIARGGGTAIVYDHVRRRAGMAGLEARHPLYDVDVIELVLRLRPEYALDPSVSRPLFRQSMQGLMPDAVLRRRDKSSFDSVFHEILSSNDLPVARSLLTDSSEVRAYLRPDALERDLLTVDPADAELGLQGWALYVWRLVTAECWLRAQEDPGFPQRLAESADLQAGRYTMDVKGRSTFLGLDGVAADA